MSSALFGILQLDRGEPYGYGEVAGLVQAWLQDAGGFAAVGLIIYLLYALSTPTDKSQSEKLRVPVSSWMMLMGAISLVCYAGYLMLLITGKAALPEPKPLQPGEMPPLERPVWRTELRPQLLALAGLFAILGIGEPFARDLLKIARRNFSFGSSGLRRFGQSVRAYAADLLTPNRVIALVVALVVYALLGALLFVLGVPKLTGIWTGVLLVAVGVLVCALFLLMLFEAEGPVWAIAKLSFKEAIRSQVLWIFLIMAFPVLFPIQWFGSSKPADELRSTSVYLTLFLSLLVLIPAALIASFGIPDDIKRLNIFTVVSKPIERFEIVLGRFVGYVALMTLVMLALTGVSLVMVTNNTVSKKALDETYKARVPYRGRLEFKSLVAAERTDKTEFTGTNVGREFDYRKYISGADVSPQRAIWRFAAVPADMARAEGDRVPVEFTFDIFKMTKGEQNRGAVTMFQFATHNCPLRPPTRSGGKPEPQGEWQWVVDADGQDYAAAVERLQTGTLLDETLAARLRPGAENTSDVQKKQLRLAQRMKSLVDRLKALGVNVTENGNGHVSAEPANVNDARTEHTGLESGLNALAEEFGFYEIRGKEVFDYQVMRVEVPAGLFRNALKNPPGKDKDTVTPLPAFSVYIKCESDGQLLGVAEPDLYLLQNELPYAYNFIKAQIGLWCRLCIVVGVAVAISTYLSGVLTLLATAFIFITGFFTDHLNDLATNRNIGGGPFQSMSQLFKAEHGTKPLDDTASTRALLFGDKFAAWVVRRVQNMIPDVDSFSWGHFVAEGFNVNTEFLVVNLLITFGYLLPWAVLAYYLMKSREVAA